MNKKYKLEKKAEAAPKVVEGANIQPKYDVIKVAVDWHAKSYQVARMIDNGRPEPPQRFTPEAFLAWMQKQLTLGKRVCCCYEAGPGGFVLYRQLDTLGVESYVIAPRKLDKKRKRVKSDKRDVLEMISDFDRYLNGNDKAVVTVYVPTPEEEQRRAESRQRHQLVKHRHALASQGRSLLLTQGWRYSNGWWKRGLWEKLQKLLPQWLTEMLETFRKLILATDETIQTLTRRIKEAAPAVRPKGLGRLSYEQITREICNFGRFKSDKSLRGYTGLTGGLFATGDSFHELSITKTGNARLREWFIELAWRFVIYQPQSKLIQRWKDYLLNPQAHTRARKKAIVAVACQLAVDLRRWLTGRATPEDLGWVMAES